MKKFLIVALLVLSRAFSPTVLAATNGVVVGADVQAVIDASAAGDTLLMTPGVYTNNLVFNKAMRVAPTASANGSEIQLLGTVTVQNNSSISFQKVYFGGGFEATASTVTILDSTHNASIVVKGGRTTMKRVVLNAPAGAIFFTNIISFEAIRLKALAPITGYGHKPSSPQFKAVQCEFSGSLWINDAKVWLGYNTTAVGAGSNIRLTECDSILIGNRFRVNINGGAPFVIDGGTFKAFNNLFANYSGAPGLGVYRCNGEFVNNTFYAGSYPVSVATVSGPVYFRNTIHKSVNNYLSLDVNPDSSSLVFASHCIFQGGGDPQSLVVPRFVNCTYNVDPALTGDLLSLDPGSPCINAGINELIYRNRDGTRNTVGYTGGPYYNPANYTNENPMVFLLQGPQTILKGTQTTIPVNAAASAGH